MNITKKKLSEAVEQKIISPDQASELFDFLQEHAADSPQFIFTHVLYYLGGLIAIGAMTLFMNLGWESFGGIGIVAISLLYSALGLKMTQTFANKNLHLPAGICATFVVCLTPLTIYGLQQWLGIWPDDSVYKNYYRHIEWHWLYMELGTLCVGAIVIWKYKYPFLNMPIAITLWFMSMDLAVMYFGPDTSWEMREFVSLYFGLLMIFLALWIDLRSQGKADYAFWIYLCGVVAFWGGLSLQNSDSELSKFIYLCINLLMVGVGVVLVRRVFVIFGAIGSCIYLGHLAQDVFEDSWLFPIALTAIGLSIIYLGVLWQKHEDVITEKSRRFLPLPLRQLLEDKSSRRT